MKLEPLQPTIGRPPAKNWIAFELDHDVNMAPNVFVDTGAHFPLTLSLTGGGVINQASLGPLFTAQPHTNAGDTNPPTGLWNDTVAGNCGSGGSSGGCGSTMSFLIDNFGGFVAATQPFQGFQVYAK